MTGTSSTIGSSVLGSTAAAWPVSEMNTSSSVGRCRLMSSIPTSASSSRRTASAIMPRVPAHRRAHGPVRERRLLDADLGQRGDRALGVGRVLEAHLQPLAADLGLELVRRALGDHAAVVDHDDPIGEPVGLVEVLRRQQHGRALRDAALDRLPEREPAARVEPGGRLVEEQHRRAEHERGGEVEPAAHAAGVGLRRPLGGLGELEALEQLAARARARPRGACGRAGRPSRGSRSRSGSRRPRRTARRARSWRAARRRRARRRARRPARCPPSASSRVARIRTAVVLPAPLGPSRPSTLPVRAAKSTPQSARTEPYDFSRPSTTIASSVMRSKLAKAGARWSGCPHPDALA